MSEFTKAFDYTYPPFRNVCVECGYAEKSYASMPDWLCSGACRLKMQEKRIKQLEAERDMWKQRAEAK